jgi:cell wall-associated NlpC family hydrolase
VQPGDLIFFSMQGAGASHVGMAIGGDEFVHAPSSRGEVRVERLSAAYWSSRYVGARRIN